MKLSLIFDGQRLKILVAFRQSECQNKNSMYTMAKVPYSNDSHWRYLWMLPTRFGACVSTNRS